MTYRKVRKAYCNKFGHYFKMTFSSKKTGKVNKKASKLASGRIMQYCLIHNKSGIDLLIESTDEQGKMERYKG